MDGITRVKSVASWLRKTAALSGWVVIPKDLENYAKELDRAVEDLEGGSKMSESEEEKYEAEIERIMDSFNFNACRSVMITMGWTWGSELPSIERMRQTARSYLERVAFTDTDYISSGRFTARNEMGRLSLTFYVEEEIGEEPVA